MADHSRVRLWLVQLGRLTMGKLSPTDAADWLEVTVPALAMRFDDAAFNPKSLEHVAAECDYLPAYGALVKLIADWAKTQPVEATRIAAPDTRETEQRAATWRHITHEEVRRKVATLEGHPYRVALGRVLAKALECNAPHLRSMLPPEFLTPEPPRKPAEIIPIADHFEQTHGRKMGELTREQLDALRHPEPVA